MFPNWYFSLEALWVFCWASAQIWSYAISGSDTSNVAFAVARADIYSLRVHVAVIAIVLSQSAFRTRWTHLMFLVALLSDTFNMMELAAYSAVRDASTGLYVYSTTIAAYQTTLTVLAWSIFWLRRQIPY